MKAKSGKKTRFSFDLNAYLCHIKFIGAMFKKLALVFAWFLATPLLLVTTGVLASRDNTLKSKVETDLPPIIISQASGSNNLEGQVLGTQISDIRPFIVAKFLKNTALEPYSALIVEVSDKYDIDYRFIPAIAMKESQGGNTARSGSFNAWGFENGRTNFASWESAIDKVGKTLKERYIAKGLTTPDQMMGIYAPPQLLTGGKWAKDINSFFSRMESL